MTNKMMDILLRILVLVGLYLTSLYSYPLFHTLVEIYIVVIAGSIFVLAWNSRKSLDNNYLLFIGISYLFVGIIELLHTLAYKGMGVFQGFDANLPTQLWIAARYMQSVSLLIAPLYLRRRLNQNLVFSIYVIVTFFLLNSIFYWNIFPDCFIEGSGLTPFKKISEYIIILILSISIGLLLRYRSEFKRDVLLMIVLSLVLTVLAELSFTFYINVYGLSNLIGHFFTLISFYLIYRAIIVTGLTRPFDLLFRNLAQSEAALKRVNEELEATVGERTADLIRTNEQLKVEVTERKGAEVELRNAHEYLQQLISSANVMIVGLDADGRVRMFNHAAERITGYTVEELTGIEWFEKIVPKDRYAYVWETFQDYQQKTGAMPTTFENPILTKAGEERFISWQNSTISAMGAPISTISFGIDITERIRGEEALHRLNRELQAISDCNQVLMRAEDEQTLLNEICRIVCDEAGYRMAWVGNAENDDAKTVRPVAWAGVEDGYLANANITWADTERGHGPSGKAIRSGATACIEDFATDPQAAPWRETALQRGYRSCIALPLKDENANTFGALCIYSMEPNTFTPDEIRLLEELAGDLAFGITVLRARLELKRAEEALRESEKKVRRKLDAILSPETDIEALELSDIIDSEKVQKLMDEFYRLTNVGIGIIDLHGKVLVGTGWQDVCTKFHRVNPESCRLCIESDLELSSNVPVGTFKQYRCKNNMWDIATPIMLGDKHMGNIFLGQFLFDDETPDYEAFRQQAYRYGFDEQEYIAALDRVPRWSRKMVNTAMSFYTAFSGMVGNLSYSNIKLASTLAARTRVEAALRESEERFRDLYENAPNAYFSIGVDGLISRCNRRAGELLGYAVEELVGRPVMEFYADTAHGKEKATQVLQRFRAGETVRDEELEMQRANGNPVWISLSVDVVRDVQGWVVESRSMVLDITGRKRAEEKVYQLASIVHSSDDAIIGKTLDGIVTSWNKGAEMIYGYTESEMIGKQISILLPPEHEDEAPQILKRVKSGEHVERYETVRQRKDGQRIFMSLTISPVRDREGRITGASTIGRDITKNKRVESIMQARLRLMELANSCSLDDLLTATLDEIEALTESKIGFYHFLESDQRKLSLQSWSTNTLKNMCAAAGKGSHYDIAQAGVWVDCITKQTPVIHNDYSALPHRKGMPEGHAPVVREAVVPIFRGNLIKAIIGVGNKSSNYGENDIAIISQVGDLSWDIVERKRAEEALRNTNETLRATLEAAPVAIFDLDTEGRVKSLWNATAEQMLGWRRDEVIGRFLPSVSEDKKDEFARFRDWIRSGKRMMGHDVVRRRKDGSLIEYSIYAAPEYDDDGKISGNIAVLVDIADRKRAEEEIRKLNLELEQRVRDRTAQLEAANKELEAFAYSVSHDLRAPLRHVDGFVELLQKRTATALDEQSEHYMSVISDSTRRMGMLIDDLLSFSRMSRQEMSKMQVDLGSLVQKVIRELQPEAEGRNIHWRVADLPVVTGDRAMLRVVLVNLLSNALKFTRPREQAEIEIGCILERNNETVVFVRDNGVGFDMNYADKLFGVFQRLHRADEFEGTGIGLANVRRIVNRHGGRAWAEGKVNQGATSFFSLPQSDQGA